MKITTNTISAMLIASMPLCQAVAGQSTPVTKSHHAHTGHRSHKVNSNDKPLASARPTFNFSNSGAGPRTEVPPEVTKLLGDSFGLSSQGDAAAQQHQWQAAISDYRQSLALVPDNRQALYGMAKCAAAAGDTANELDYFRSAIYSHDPSVYGTVPGDSYQENDVQKLMAFVLALGQAGQTAEAMSVCDRAIGLINDNLVAHVKLPLLDTENYTPARLPAMAHLVTGIDMSWHGDPDTRSQLEQATALAPDLAAAHYYLGKYLYGYAIDNNAAKAELEQAVQLGDEQTAAEANVYLSCIR